jgi:hypothetical protein
LNLGLDAGYLDRGLRGFPQPLQTYSGILSQLGHGRFFPNYMQFIADYVISPFAAMLCDLDIGNIVKYSTTLPPTAPLFERQKTVYA